MKLPLLLTLAFLAATALADPLPTDGNFYTWSFGGVGSTGSPTWTVNFAVPGFVEVTDDYCVGDQFEVFVDNTSVGKTSVPAPATCSVTSGGPSFTIADARWSSGRFFVGAGSHTVTIKPVASPFGGGGAWIRAVPGKCQGPPGIPSDKFAVVVDSKVAHSGYPNICAKYNLDPAEVTSSNLAAASLTARQCMPGTSPFWIKSWNSDTYAGASIALYPSQTGGTVNIAADPQYSLCQKKPTSLQTSGAGFQIYARSPDQKLFIVGPPMAYGQTGNACASFGTGAVPAILHSAQQTLYAEASALVFSAAGPNGRAWIGGWEEKTQNQNNALVLSAGATSGPGSVNPGGSDPLYVVCAVPGSGADKRKREPEPEPAANQKRAAEPEPGLSDEL